MSAWLPRYTERVSGNTAASKSSHPVCKWTKIVLERAYIYLISHRMLNEKNKDSKDAYLNDVFPVINKNNKNKINNKNPALEGQALRLVPYVRVFHAYGCAASQCTIIQFRLLWRAMTFPYLTITLRTIPCCKQADFSTSPIKGITKLEILSWRIVDQRNATHEKRASVEHWKIIKWPSNHNFFSPFSINH